MYVGERGGKFQHLTVDNPLFSQTHYIFAGKLRRYSGEAWWRRLIDIKTLLLNLRDVFYIAFGIVEALWLLGRLRPNVIFVKGGFVGLPVGIAAAIWRIPFVTHDSDSSPGLTNRVIGRWARVNATALPKKFYSYHADRIRQVGVPVAEQYQSVNSAQKTAFRKELDIPPSAQVVVVTGGSQGATSMNRLLAPQLRALLDSHPKLHIIHQTGKHGEGLYPEVHPRLQAAEYLTDMYRYTAAADVVVGRPGATTVAELAEQGRACILIPGYLADNHQLKNARYLEDHQAALMFTEKQLKEQPGLILDALNDLLQDETARQRLADQLQATAHAGATQQLATILLDLADAQTA